MHRPNYLLARDKNTGAWSFGGIGWLGQIEGADAGRVAATLARNLDGEKVRMRRAARREGNRVTWTGGSAVFEGPKADDMAQRLVRMIALA